MNIMKYLTIVLLLFSISTVFVDKANAIDPQLTGAEPTIEASGAALATGIMPMSPTQSIMQNPALFALNKPGLDLPLLNLAMGNIQFGSMIRTTKSLINDVGELALEEIVEKHIDKVFNMKINTNMFLIPFIPLNMGVSWSMKNTFPEKYKAQWFITLRDNMAFDTAVFPEGMLVTTLNRAKVDVALKTGLSLVVHENENHQVAIGLGLGGYYRAFLGKDRVMTDAFRFVDGGDATKIVSEVFDFYSETGSVIDFGAIYTYDSKKWGKIKTSLSVIDLGFGVRTPRYIEEYSERGNSGGQLAPGIFSLGLGYQAPLFEKVKELALALALQWDIALRGPFSAVGVKGTLYAHYAFGKGPIKRCRVYTALGVNGGYGTAMLGVKVGNFYFDMGYYTVELGKYAGTIPATQLMLQTGFKIKFGEKAKARKAREEGIESVEPGLNEGSGEGTIDPNAEQQPMIDTTTSGESSEETEYVNVNETNTTDTTTDPFSESSTDSSSDTTTDSSSDTTTPATTATSTESTTSTE